MQVSVVLGHLKISFDTSHAYQRCASASGNIMFDTFHHPTRIYCPVLVGNVGKLLREKKCLTNRNKFLKASQSIAKCVCILKFPSMHSKDKKKQVKLR
jgi:hypothetical protein